MKKWMMVSAILIGIGVAQTAHAQAWSTTQAIIANAQGNWSYITNWNLSTGALAQSPTFRSDNYRWNHTVLYHQQWNARFLYNASTGRTRRLAWFYGQQHFQ